jgi:hypothetical protein
VNTADNRETALSICRKIATAGAAYGWSATYIDVPVDLDDVEVDLLNRLRDEAE